jgi:hypothetical protein
VRLIDPQRRNRTPNDLDGAEMVPRPASSLDGDVMMPGSSTGF